MSPAEIQNGFAFALDINGHFKGVPGFCDLLGCLSSRKRDSVKSINGFEVVDGSATAEETETISGLSVVDPP